MTTQENIEQQRLAYVEARLELLNFFLAHSFNNDTNEFSYHMGHVSDKERLKYFIGIFDELYNDNEVIQCDIVFGNEMIFVADDTIPYEVIKSIKKSIKIIEKYHG